MASFNDRIFESLSPGRGQVPRRASPSNGKRKDDVKANLTAGEFVIPKKSVDATGPDYWRQQVAATGGPAPKRTFKKGRQYLDTGGEADGSDGSAAAAAAAADAAAAANGYGFGAFGAPGAPQGGFTNGGLGAFGFTSGSIGPGGSSGQYGGYYGSSSGPQGTVSATPGTPSQYGGGGGSGGGGTATMGGPGAGGGGGGIGGGYGYGYGGNGSGSAATGYGAGGASSGTAASVGPGGTGGGGSVGAGNSGFSLASLLGISPAYAHPTGATTAQNLAAVGLTPVTALNVNNWGGSSTTPSNQVGLAALSPLAQEYAALHGGASPSSNFGGSFGGNASPTGAEGINTASLVGPRGTNVFGQGQTGTPASVAQTPTPNLSSPVAIAFQQANPGTPVTNQALFAFANSPAFHAQNIAAQGLPPGLSINSPPSAVANQGYFGGRYLPSSQPLTWQR